MTQDTHQTSSSKRASAVLFGLLFAGLFVVAINQTLGYIVWALAPIAATVEALGYPVAITRVAEKAAEARSEPEGE